MRITSVASLAATRLANTLSAISVNLTDPSGRIALPGAGVTLYSALRPSAILVLCRADLRRNFGGL
ncbi:MAG: hypothetical protein IPK52_20635 [Chloroflexi bacterium]|nr:hypothetical protein [Chloroflexota bacterium]